MIGQTRGRGTRVRNAFSLDSPMELGIKEKVNMWHQVAKSQAETFHPLPSTFATRGDRQGTRKALRLLRRDLE
eukprot:scaffold1337_cov165-Pinguiococcus_pyrenoidosus.AAC.1